MSAIQAANAALNAVFSVISNSAKAIDNIAIAGEKYTHVAVNHADYCDRESQLNYERRIAKIQARVDKAMDEEEKSLL